MSPSRRYSKEYLFAIAVCMGMALLAGVLHQWFDTVNIVMLFLLGVFLVSWRLGRGPAILAAFLSVGLFDFFFVPPHLTFAVADVQYLLTFAVMLIVALITGQLTALLRQQAQDAWLEESRTRALYETAKTLSGAIRLSQVADAMSDFLHEAANVEALLLLPDITGKLQPQGAAAVWVEPHLAAEVYESGAPLCEGDGVRYYPLRGATRMRGVLAVALQEGGRNNDGPLLEAVASLVTIAVERLHYVEVAQQAQVEMASERLRSSVLSALSHDLRTPLTILVGLADSLALSRPALQGRQQEGAAAIRDQAMRLAGLVESLLDMARLHAGEVRLRREWQPLEEVVGASLQLLERALVDRPVHIALESDLPLLEFDAVLIERVFCNLLENAAKHSPAGSPIEIAASLAGDYVEVTVRDYGRGIAPERQNKIFEMFVRGEPESSLPGVGLGLAICRAIVEAHGGTITCANRDPGACFMFTLPVGEPPLIDEDGAQADE